MSAQRDIADIVEDIAQRAGQAIGTERVGKLDDQTRGHLMDAATELRARAQNYSEGLDAWRKNNAYHAGEIQRLQRLLAECIPSVRSHRNKRLKDVTKAREKGAPNEAAELRLAALSNLLWRIEKEAREVQLNTTHEEQTS